MSFQLIRSIPVKNEEGEFRKYILDEDKLSSLINQAQSQQTEIAVLAIAGAFRTGKSFLLSIIHNYLEKLSNGDNPWEDKIFSVNDGFKFRRGQDPETEGIYCSNKIFTIPAETKSGKLSVILLDTEGAFDHRSTMQDNATIFSLSTLYSSMQLANVKRQIQSTDIANLQMFTEVGKLAIDGDIQRKPFQDFIFLIRDYEHGKNYGFDEGLKMLNKIDKESALVDNKDNTPNVRKVFQTFRACCLPHPGKIVTQNKFTGDLKECKEKFVDTIKEFLEEIFKNLKPKTNMNGDLMSLKDIGNHFRAYADIFAGDTIPKTGNILDVSATSHYQIQLAAAKKDLEEILKKNFNIVEIRSLEDANKRQDECLRIYNELNKNRKFLNPQVYAKQFWKESAHVFEELMNEKYIKYQIQHDKELSEQEKARIQRDLEETRNERKRVAAKREKEFADQIKENRRQIESEREKSRQSEKEFQKWKRNTEEARHKQELELLNAQQASLALNNRVIEELRNENNRLRRTRRGRRRR